MCSAVPFMIILLFESTKRSIVSLRMKISEAYETKNLFIQFQIKFQNILLYQDRCNLGQILS